MHHKPDYKGINMNRHFWYSEKQQSVLEAFDMESNNKCIINGKILPYTVCSKTEKHCCLFDDMEYLGQGEIYSINGVIQR
jgi:hypothetical protein